jgi:hypothetical protein
MLLFFSFVVLVCWRCLGGGFGVMLMVVVWVVRWQVDEF